VKSGALARAGRRLTARDLLLAAQVSICAVLITSSLVAVRGLMRSLHADFGVQLQNVTMVEADLSMAGYRGEKVPEIQKRILDEDKVHPRRYVGWGWWTIHHWLFPRPCHRSLPSNKQI